MECKDIWNIEKYYTIRIRIYPEWNVKVISDIMGIVYNSIRIYPEWNVKMFWMFQIFQMVPN